MKKYIVLGLSLALFSVALAAPYFYTLYIRTALVLQPGASITVGSGGSALAGIYADTSAFSTTAQVKAIYIPGATIGSKAYVTERVILGNSAAPSSDSSHFSYMVKTDSLIVYRTPSIATGVFTSGTKFSYLVIK